MLWAGGGFIKIDYIEPDTINEFDRKIEVARIKVLSESPEIEAMLQQKDNEKHPEGKRMHSLCDTPMLQFEAQRISSVEDFPNKRFGNKAFYFRNCYRWFGTRHDWKENILSKQLKGN